jgi:hypothetical protein
MTQVKAPQIAMMVGRYKEGFHLTRIMLEGGSNATYVTKKTTRAMEYSFDVSFRSSAIPAIFAFPMLVMLDQW